MSQIISIVGPTATGKTSLALKIAKDPKVKKKFSGVDIISVDSRQVYKGLEIVSGADIPSNDKLQMINVNLKIYGVAIINPDEEWSLVHFLRMALSVIESAVKENRLVIFVGGTGLYHDKLINLIDSSGNRMSSNTFNIPPDKKLREELEKLSVQDLQERLQKLSPEKWQSMNHSDRNNPRRLIRAMEIADAGCRMPHFAKASRGKQDLGLNDYLTLGLKDSLENIERKIKKRVLDRFHNGAIEEVQTLLNKYGDMKALPALSATGVKEIGQYLSGELSDQECLEKWTLREFQYAKRQVTWWKNKNVKWYMVNDKCLGDIVNLIHV